MLSKARQVISLGRGQAEVTLLSVRQDVVKSMEGHFTWQGPSRSDFAACEARCCEKHGRSLHVAGPSRSDFQHAKSFHLAGASRSDFAVCEARCCEKHGRSFHLAGAKQK